jgi:hypothetical protein
VIVLSSIFVGNFTCPGSGVAPAYPEAKSNIHSTIEQVPFFTSSVFRIVDRSFQGFGSMETRNFAINGSWGIEHVIKSWQNADADQAA